MKTCEGNSKTLSISARFFFFVMLIYSSFFINFLHLRFLITTLKKKFLKPPLEEWGLCPVPHGFILRHPQLAHMTGKILLSHPCPLRPREAPPHLIKLYFLLICSQLLQFFLLKPFC